MFAAGVPVETELEVGADDEAGLGVEAEGIPAAACAGEPPALRWAT